MTEASLNALPAVLGEFKNISPELTGAFVFNKNGEALAGGQIISEEQMKRLSIALNDVDDQAEVIGGVEALTVQGVNSQLTITSLNNRYLATVSSRVADEKMIKALTSVIVPTIVSLVDQLMASPKGAQTEALSEAKPFEETFLSPVESKLGQVGLVDPPLPIPEPMLPKPPVNQFMVEKIGGLLVASDTVRVDADLVAKWTDLYGDKEVTQVNVETLEGKAVVCKFKVMKHEDGRSKGMIQIPEKIMQSLGTGEGKLVVVKPVISLGKE